ncbi:MAG TPA: hypothetical protein DCZ94_15385 [Lentisphaeria bacterium]|nr:MAG: hypothetical protein A2X48_17225 [Lentisphaerae bacterium GWF2_49_21]HBC88334.1 hypothetical protein [Lentisphaeria bacterium]
MQRLFNIPVIAPTKKGIVFLCLCALIYLSATQSQSGLLFLVLGIIVGALVLNIFLAFQLIRKVKVDMDEIIKATEGCPVPSPMKITNRSKFSLGLIEISSQHGILTKIYSLPAVTDSHVMPEIVFPRRGIYPLKKLLLKSTYPFGLVKATLNLSGSGEAVVFPDIYKCLPAQASGFEPMVGGSCSDRHTSPSGFDFSGVRPMQSGDSFRHIHWKSSAKGTGIMIKEFSEELSGRLTIILDNRASAGMELCDIAARAAGSLAFSSLDAGHHVEMVDPSRADTLVVPPFSTGDALLEFIARTELSADFNLLEKIKDILGKISSRSSVVIVAVKREGLDEAVEYLLSQNRKVSLYIPETMKEDSFPANIKVHKYARNTIYQ